MSFNPASVQAAVRQNSQELASYLHDLHSWEKDIKHKEKQLKAGSLTLTKPRPSSTSSIPSTLPPIRNGQPPLTLKDPTADDAARFAELKGRGNALFGEGRYEAAIECYNSCVILQSKDPLPLSNRAQCHLKLRSFSEAALDCDAALALEPGHVKSRFRRATARKELGQTQPAIDDLQRVLQLEPNNKPAQSVHTSSETAQMLKELKAGTVQAEAKEALTPPARPTTDSSSAREAPRRKLVIQEEDDDEDSDEEFVPINNSRRDTQPATTSLPLPVASTTLQPTSKPLPAPTPAARAQPKVVEMDVDNPSALSGPSHSNSQPPPSNTSTASPPSLASKPPTVPTSAAASPVPSVAAAEGLRQPRSAMDFDSQYRGVRSDPARLSALLQLIPAAEYPTILRTSLDASLFTHILRAVDLHLVPVGDAVGVWRVLSSLPTVPRFSLTAGFLGSKDKQALQRAFQMLLTAPPQGTDQEAIRSTASKYKVTDL